MNRREWKELEEAYKDMMKKYQKPEEYIKLEELENEIEKTKKLFQKTQKLKIINYFVREDLKSSCQQYNKVKEYIVTNHIKDRGYQINESECAYRYDDYGNLKTLYRHSDGDLYEFEEIVL